MKNCLNRRFLNIFLLITLAGFLVLPKTILASDFEEITPAEIEKYLELPEKDAKSLLFTLKQVFTTDWIYRESSGYSTDEERLIPLVLRRAVRIDALNHLLIDAPIEITGNIIKNGIKISRILLLKDLGGLFEEIEKESVKIAVNYGMNALLQNEIRVTPGAIEFKYISQKEEERKVIFQYVLIYQPLESRRGKVAIRFYSPNPVEPPKSQGSAGFTLGIASDLQHDLPPFIVEITGRVEKDELDNYWWIDEKDRRFTEGPEPLLVQPSVKIILSENVPDLGIRPLSFWEKYLLKPIETTIKDVEVIITKVTGKSPKLVNIWEEVKKFISKIKSLSPAALAPAPEIPKVEEQPLTVKGTKEGIIREIREIPEVEEEMEEEAVEVRPQPIKPEPKPELTPGERLAEIRERLDDIAERIDVLSQKIANLSGEEKKIVKAEEKSEEEMEEEETEEEIEEEEVGQEVGQKLCGKVNINTATKEELQKITGIGPVLAQRIIEARPFYSLNDLLKVKGIGQVTLEKIIAQGCAYVEGFYFTGGAPPPISTQPQPQISLSYPQNNPVNKIEVTLSGSNLDDTTYDVKISIEKGTTTLSEIYNENLNDWQSSYKYVTSIVSGTSFSKKFELRIKDDYEDFRGEADIFAKIRKTGKKSSYLEFNGKINITAPPPILEVSTTTLNFEAIEDVKKPKDQFLTIQNLGGGSLNWKISFSTNWLKFDPLEGSISPHSSSTIKVSIDINGLAAGNYDATFNIEATGAQNSPQSIQVKLTVYEKRFAKGLIISEVKISGEEFVEIYNPKEATSTEGLYLSYFPSGHDWNNPWRINTQFPTTTIVSSTYFLIGFKDYSVGEGYPELDWQPSTSTNLSDTAGSIGIFSCNPKSASTSEEAMSCKIDLVGWDKKNEISVKEGDSVPSPPEEKSLGRKIAIDDNGNLNYLDLDNNRLDFEIQNPTPKEQNENLPPIAEFDFSPKNPRVGDNILFNASPSSDSDGNISLFIWDFGDGNFSTTSSKINYFFSTSSSFNVSLSVIDDLGATSTPTTTQIFVSSREPLSVVINEIAWMGTRASSSDEWIEFYNATSEDIDIINWSIFWAKTGNCLNFSNADGFSTTTILMENFLIYAKRQESITLANQSIVDIWDDDIEMDDNSPSQLILYDAPNCQGDLIDVVGEINEGWFFGNALNFVSMERISATTTGATSTNWANNNLITRNSLDVAGNPIFGTPKSQNSVLKSPTVLTQLNLDELLKYFDEITLTYLGSPYIIGEYPYGNILSVPSGKTLNIEPGVVLKFVASSVPGYGSSLEINGTLRAIGEETKPITFTRFEESTGTHWLGIYFSFSSQNSILDWVIIEKARSWDSAHFAIKVDQSSVSFKNLTIENYYNRWGILLINSPSIIASSTFSEFIDTGQGSEPSAIYIIQGNPTIENSIFKKNTCGINIEQGASPIIEGNYFEENKYPIYALDSYPSLTGNQFLRNDVNGILIKGNLSRDTTWKAGITYVIDYYVGVMASTTLTIEPGTIVKFKAASGAPGYQAYFQVAGSLIATGIENSKIVFTSFNDDEYGGDTNNDGTSTTPNYWDWKEITFTSGSSGSLKWAIIRYGGWFTNNPLVIQEGANVNVSQENVIIEFSSQP